jgi:hypothetical protein
MQHVEIGDPVDAENDGLAIYYEMLLTGSSTQIPTIQGHRFVQS